VRRCLITVAVKIRARLLATLPLLAACSSSPAPTPADAGADVPRDVAQTDLGAPVDLPAATDAGADSAVTDRAVADSADAASTEPACDPVSPTRCGLPFPNDYWTVADPSTPTGLRLRLDADMLPRATPQWFAEHDGFSPGATLLAHIPGAVATGLASWRDIERSLTDASPTLLIDAETGARVAHFAELDVTTRDTTRRALLIRPVRGLTPGRRYAVAVRDLRDEGGAVIAPSEAFRALRDDTPSTEVTAAMRARYQRVFSTLQRGNAPRNTLQLAWDFTVASRRSTTRRLLEMRDAALTAAGPMGPSYRITSVRRNPRAGIAMAIEGEVTVPLFLTRAEPGGSMVRDANGAPQQNGTAFAPFWMLVPPSALTRPAGLLQYGHGLLSSGEDLLSDPGVIAFASAANLVVFGMDLQGMAQDDTATIAAVISGNDIGRFRDVVDRQHQGLVNWLLLMRAAMNRMPTDPMLRGDSGPLIDPQRRFYYGASQGGIFGGTYMAITPDVTRGVLGVPGQAYALMLNRSINFETFAGVLRARFPDPLDVQRVVGLVQMLWDRTEPSGWTPYVRTDRVPGTPAHEVLMLVSIGDRQVPPLAAHLMARTLDGVPNLAPVNRELYGIPTRTGSVSGSAMVEFDFGLPDAFENVPSPGTPDPHSRITESPPAFTMATEWLETGTVQNRCDGPCDPR